MQGLSTEVSTVEGGQKVRVPIETKEAPVWENGLLRTQVRGKPKKTEAIGVFRCSVCQEEREFFENEGGNKWCCEKKMDLVDIVERANVKEITSRQTAYKCPKCNKVYKWPADCCVAKGKLDIGEMREF